MGPPRTATHAWHTAQIVIGVITSGSITSTPGSALTSASARAPLADDMAAAAGYVAGRIEWRETGAGPHGETGLIQAKPEAWGDVVLARRDTPASYNLCVVVDDAIQGITDVVRGRDLFHATSVHRLLQELLGLPVPVYHHHDLVMGDDGRKLSKSRRDTALRSLRDAGATPDDIRRMVGL